MMKVILIEDVTGLGQRGDVVDVADGYGRNFLLPQQKAVKATTGALRQAEADRKAREQSELRAREEAEAIARALSGSRVVLAAQAGDEGRLFGSIGPGDIVEGIKKFTGIAVDRKSVHLEAPIRTIGLHEVHIKLHAQVWFSVALDVIPG